MRHGALLACFLALCHQTAANKQTGSNVAEATRPWARAEAGAGLEPRLWALPDAADSFGAGMELSLHR